MALTTEERQGVDYLILKGELVTGEEESRLNDQLERLARKGRKRVVVDLSEVPYIDSSVLGKLVYGHSLFKQNGGALRLLSPSPRVMDLLEVTRLISVFEVFDDPVEVGKNWG